MKFFKNLPKINFTSSIGTYSISDFFTYLDVEHAPINEGTINIDDKTTLIEASYKFYNDTNTLWAFVAANNVINPFDLLAPNTITFQKSIVGKINLTLFDDPDDVTGGIALPVGSILLPSIGNIGPSYSYGFTGNYNLYGALAVVEESSFYDGNMVIGSQVGGPAFIVVGAPTEKVIALQKNTDGSFTNRLGWYTGNKTTLGQKVIKIVESTDGKIIIKGSTSSKVTIDELLPKSPPVKGAAATTTTTSTVSQTVADTSKIIQAYTPSELGLIQSSFVTTKYN
jgi:hypothetical protein